MSTQRREDGYRPDATSGRMGPRDRWQASIGADRTQGWSRFWLFLMVWSVRVMAAVETAPLFEASPLQTGRTATNSLQTDHQTTQPVRQDRCRILRCSPPLQAGAGASFGASATRRLSLRLTPRPSVLASIRPSWPQDPAGRRRWMERYDGKRDLHLLHAA
jgi:hypothetical protein